MSKIELDGGDYIEWANDATLRRMDSKGNCKEIRKLEHQDWSKWAVLFMTQNNKERE